MKKTFIVILAFFLLLGLSGCSEFDYPGKSHFLPDTVTIDNGTYRSVFLR